MRFRGIVWSMWLLALEVGALLVLLAADVPAIDWAHLGQWLENVAPEDAVVSVARLLALGTAWYLVVTTILYALAKLTRIPGLIRGARLVTMPGIRRLVDGAMVASLVAAPSAALLTPTAAYAHERPSASAHHYVPSPAGDRRDPYVPKPAGPDVESPTSAGDSYEVKPGDNLWSIASAQLATRSGRTAEELSEGEIRSVWLSIVEANAATIISGDPNLIFREEELTIPPL